MKPAVPVISIFIFLFLDTEARSTRHGGSEYTEVHGVVFLSGTLRHSASVAVLSRRLGGHGDSQRVISQWFLVSWCLSGNLSRRLGGHGDSRRIFTVVLSVLVPQWLAPQCLSINNTSNPLPEHRHIKVNQVAQAFIG